MLHGSCHCGAVQWDWTHPVLPEGATACNCTVCRRYGVLWIYDFENEGLKVSGTTRAYIRGQGVEFHFCPTCGCVAYWRSLTPEADGRRRIAVNLRLAEPAVVAAMPIDRFDGLESFTDQPRDGRTVRLGPRLRRRDRATLEEQRPRRTERFEVDGEAGRPIDAGEEGHAERALRLAPDESAVVHQEPR